MRTLYNPEDFSDAYRSYYVNQVGNGYGVFSGAPVQRGAGLGSRLGALASSSFPMILNGVKSVGKQLLKTGLNMAKDVMDGQSLKESAAKNIGSTGRDILESLAETVGSSQSKKRKLTTTRRPGSGRVSKPRKSFFKTVAVK